jgi:hypothetical protein
VHDERKEIVVYVEKVFNSYNYLVDLFISIVYILDS